MSDVIVKATGSILRTISDVPGDVFPSHTAMKFEEVSMICGPVRLLSPEKLDHEPEGRAMLVRI